MKLSDHFSLHASQHELDFIDIDLDNDTPLFIDPHSLATRVNSLSVDATKSVRSFFRYFLALVRARNEAAALELFLHLREPNETRLGLSRGRSQGRGIGEDGALKISTKHVLHPASNLQLVIRILLLELGQKL